MRDKNSINHKNILIMKTNVCLYDQAGRVLLAIAIAALYYFKVVEGTTSQVLLILAGLLVLTSYLKMTFEPASFLLQIAQPPFLFMFQLIIAKPFAKRVKRKNNADPDHVDYKK